MLSLLFVGLLGVVVGGPALLQVWSDRRDAEALEFLRSLGAPVRAASDLLPERSRSPQEERRLVGTALAAAGVAAALLGLASGSVPLCASGAVLCNLAIVHRGAAVVLALEAAESTAGSAARLRQRPITAV